MTMTSKEKEAVKKRNKVLGDRIQRYLKAEPEDKKRYWLSYWQAQRELIKINELLIESDAKKIARKLSFRNREEFEANVDELRYIPEDAAMRAARDYNPSRGEYSTYFKRCLKSGIKMHFSRELRRLGTIPYPIARRYAEISRIETRLTYKLEREPTPDEIIQELERTGRNDKRLGKIDNYHLEWLKISGRPVFDFGQNGKEDREYVIVSEKSHSPQDHLMQKEEKENLINYVNNEYINEREKKVIRSRFGFPPYTEPQTLKEVGKQLGITKERVRQMQDNALLKLRKAMEKDGHTLESFF